VYAVYETANGNHGRMEFECDRDATIVNPETGFRLSKGTTINHYFHNRGYLGMSFHIINESRVPGPPAEIKFTNAKITGEIFPDVDYMVVISGSAVAENDYYVYSEHPTVSNVVRGNEFFLFSREPYQEVMFSFDDRDTNVPGGTGWDEPPVEEPIIIPPVEIPPAALVLNDFSPPNRHGAKPVIFEELPGTGFKYGLVHVREFSDFIGAEANWNDATKTATVTGKDRYGNDLVISMVSDSSQMTVNGQTFDIAAYSGATQLTGLYTAKNTGSAIYLPFRAVANAYGSDPDWNPLTETVTFYR